MKTATEIKLMIDQEISMGKFTPAKPRGEENKKINNRIQFLKTCLYYIESGPRLGFLRSERIRLKNRISKIEA